MEDGFQSTTLRQMREVEEVFELEVLRQEFGPHGALLHCANYLYPALSNGLVGELFWVVPDRMWGDGSGVEQALELVGKWVDLSLRDWESWRVENGAVCGSLMDRPFWIGRAQQLPLLSQSQQENLALDIDVDYFVDPLDDSVWTTPYRFADIFPYRPKVLTVALSVSGGYTPVEELYWGEVCLEVFEGKQGAREMVEAVWKSTPEQWEELLKSSSAYLQPALLARLGRWREARELDSRYHLRPEDIAARFLEKRKFEAALEYLSDLSPQAPQVGELTFFCLSFLGRWTELVKWCESHSELFPKPGPEGAKMGHLLALAYMSLGRYGEARDVLVYAGKQAPESSEIWLETGVCEYHTGARKRAARSLERAIRYSRGRVSSKGVLQRCLPILESIEEPALASSARRELRLLERS